MRIDDQGHGTSLYHYDLLDRLRVVEGPNPEAFLFDPASNLLEALDGQDATDAQASKALPEPTSPNARRPQQTPGNRLKRQGNRRFNYDARGNRIEEIIERGARQGQVTRYRYNAQNQLVEVNVAGAVTRYAYDALGRRISKTSEGSSTTFFWNGNVLLGEVGSNSSRTYLFEPFSFKPLALVQNGEVFHYHTDHIGTPREITNSKAEVVWSARFKTYGALALAAVTEVDNPLRFQGQYCDEETGLHYNRHRYYDPECGQFTTQDPIGLLGGMNAYQYAPNPLTWVDPWGLRCKDAKFGRVPNQVTTSSGVIFYPNPNRTTTILGSYQKDMNDIINNQLEYPKTTDFGEKKGAFNVLNVPDDMYKNPEQFWNEVNRPFLDEAISRGDDIALATRPTADVLFKADNSVTGYGREIKHLSEAGYEFDPRTGYMTKN